MFGEGFIYMEMSGKVPEVAVEKVGPLHPYFIRVQALSSHYLQHTVLPFVVSRTEDST